METDDEAASQSMHSKLTEQLMGVFDGAAETQKAYYQANPNQRPTPAMVDALIRGWANQNALIAGGLSLIPGPWGMVAIVPEIVMVVRNQVKMVYDIGVAHGKESVMTKELLLGIVLSATGASTLGLLSMHGSKVLVKRQALRMFQKLVALLAGKITQRVIKSAIAKWLPIIGAVAIAVWTRSSTAAIGRAAAEILSKDIEFEEGDETKLLEDRSAPEPAGLATAKLRVLANLMKADGVVAEEERSYLEAILSHADIGDTEADALRASWDEPQQDDVDQSVFASSEDHATALLMDLVALAYRDGEMHPTEKLYIRRVGQRIGIAPDELELALA